MSELGHAQGIAERWARLRGEVDEVCRQAGRAPRDVRVVAVTKNHPADTVRAVAATGIVDVGENRAQELAGKAADCADLDLRWHFVGQLQTNKAAAVARHADTVHSVDRARLVGALAAAVSRQPARGPLSVLLQVNLDPDAVVGTLGPRGGCHPHDLAALADAVAAEAGLRLAGVMAVAPPPGAGVAPAAAFDRLNTLATRLRDRYPQATFVSAGMSDDWREAVLRGATHLRIGTALLGARPPIVG